MTADLPTVAMLLACPLYAWALGGAGLSLASHLLNLRIDSRAAASPPPVAMRPPNCAECGDPISPMWYWGGSGGSGESGLCQLCDMGVPMHGRKQ